MFIQFYIITQRKYLYRSETDITHKCFLNKLLGYWTFSYLFILTNLNILFYKVCEWDKYVEGQLPQVI